MATYYVDGDDGSDTYDGSVPAYTTGTTGPFATVQKVFSSGVLTTSTANTVWVKPGIYIGEVGVTWTRPTAAQRVVVDSDHSVSWATAPAPTMRRAYVTSYTPDFLTTTSGAAFTSPWNAGISLTKIEGFHFIGGGNGPVVNIAAHQSNQSTDYEFNNCVIQGTSENAATSTGASGMWFGSADGYPDGARIVGCVFIGGTYNAIRISDEGTASEQENPNRVIKNCVFTGCHQSSISSYGAYMDGGWSITNNLFIQPGQQDDIINMWGTTQAVYPISIFQNIFIGSWNGTAVYAATASSVDADENCFDIQTPYNGVTPGANDNDPLIPVMHFHKIKGSLAGEYLSQVFGVSPMIGLGNAAPYPSTDLFGRPRPGSGSDVGALGPIETHQLGVLEQSTIQAGSSALKMTGPMVHEFDIVLLPQPTIVKVYVRVNSATYGGTNYPKMSVVDCEACGMDDVGFAATAACEDAWEALSFVASPTKSGRARIRLESRDTSGSGVCYFDSFGMTS